MKNLAIGFIILLVLLGGGFYLSNVDNSSSQNTSTESNAQQATPAAQTEEFPDLMKDYNPETLAEAQEKGKTLLFFHAVWCSTCKAATRDIVRNTEDLPEDLTILRLNYDTERELKKKYGVFTQHTFVQIDENGDEVTKWIGGGVATINTNLK